MKKRKNEKTKYYFITAVITIITTVIAGLILIPFNNNESLAEKRYSILIREGDNIMRKENPNLELAFFLYDQAYQVANANSLDYRDAIEGRQKTLRNLRSSKNLSSGPKFLSDIDKSSTLERTIQKRKLTNLRLRVKLMLD
jgi:hypothetical protein